MTSAFKPAASAAATDLRPSPCGRRQSGPHPRRPPEDCRPDHLKIQVDLIERKGDVLIRFGFDLNFAPGRGARQAG